MLGAADWLEILLSLGLLRKAICLGLSAAALKSEEWLCMIRYAPLDGRSLIERSGVLRFI